MLKDWGGTVWREQLENVVGGDVGICRYRRWLLSNEMVTMHSLNIVPQNQILLNPGLGNNLIVSLPVTFLKSHKFQIVCLSGVRMKKAT